MTAAVVDELPGFRRRFRIMPAPAAVSCEVEDDFHCMAVILHHDGLATTAVEADMRRAPWTTCPGAEQILKETFTGVALTDFPRQGGKKANCTHLYDLATLAAAHAFDSGPVVYDILVSDPVRGQRRCELRRDGHCLMRWTEVKFEVVEPAELAGMQLSGDLRPWIGKMDFQRQEAARLLRWGTMLANGRQIPLEEQSDATTMPANCYTFQPQRAVIARRIGKIRDFSVNSPPPLADSESPL